MLLHQVHWTRLYNFFFLISFWLSHLGLNRAQCEVCTEKQVVAAIFRVVAACHVCDGGSSETYSLSACFSPSLAVFPPPGYFIISEGKCSRAPTELFWWSADNKAGRGDSRPISSAQMLTQWYLSGCAGQTVAPPASLFTPVISAASTRSTHNLP